MSNKPFSQRGVTLIEMIVTMVLFGIMAAVGSLLISKLVPSYLANVQAEQALSPREAAVWRLSEDFRQTLMEGTYQLGCDVYLNVASGVTGAATDVNQLSAVYYWSPASAVLWLSAPWVNLPGVSAVVLNNVSAVAGGCPLTYASGVGRARLNLMFNYLTFDGTYEAAPPVGATPASAVVTTPVSATLYSYVNGPYIAAITPDYVLNNTGSTSVSLSGVFPGAPDINIWTRIYFVSGGSEFFPMTPDTGTSAVLITTATAYATLSGVVDVKVTTPEGWSILKNAFTFVSQ